MEEVVFQYRTIHPEAKPPARSRITDAGYDLSSVAHVKIPSGKFASIPTGLQISAPDGYYYVIEGRSGMLRDGIVASHGIIDAGYCGDIFVLLHNFSIYSYIVNIGDRIAQIIPHEIIHLDFEKVDVFSSEFCIRGENGQDGWGMSGK